MTPAQHKAAAEAAISRSTNPSLIGPSVSERLAGEAHAHLANALGTGAHYAAADTLLAEADLPNRVTDPRTLQAALLHAILADR